MVTKSELESESESKSSSPEDGDEDHEIFNAELCGKDYGGIEEAQLQKEGNTNSKGGTVTTLEGFEIDGEDGLASIRLVSCSEDGLEFELGPDKLSQGGVKQSRVNSVIEEKSNAQNELDIRDSKGKRKKSI
ncbi:hypothetical protein SLE2022_143920 [Rubroshorea leprosula]